MTTSGTAAANLLPAVVEARQAEVPLLLLTADRPHRLRGADANQAIDQIGLFGNYPRAFHELAPPRVDDPALRHLRQLGCRAVADAMGPPAGPVHLNVPFEKPLEPTRVDGDVPPAFAEEHPLAMHGRPDGAPFVATASSPPALEAGLVDELVQALGAAEAPLIVAGPHPDPDRLGPAALALARRTGTPLLADPLSGARFGPGATGHALAGYDLFLRSAETADALSPDLVLRVGATPTSKHVSSYLDHHADARQIVIDAGDRYKDHLAVATQHVRADAPRTLEALTERTSTQAPKRWHTAWHETEAVTRRVLETELSELSEGSLLHRSAASLSPGEQLFVSNSMPVRDLDAFTAPRDDRIRVLANRGASGIDGVTSTAIGCATTGTPTLAVLGDLAFLHDLNGLHAARRGGPPITFLVVNNDGGGIFHMLPIREHDPPFTDRFATPHGLDLERAAALFELDHQRARSIEELEDALVHGPGPQPRIVEVRTDRGENQRWHDAVASKVVEAVEDASGTQANGGTP